MRKILAAWNLKMIHEALNIHKHLINNGRSWDDVEAYLEVAASKRLETPISVKRLVIRACPECGRPMRLYPVNSDQTKRDRVDAQYKSMWLCGTSCSGKGCLHEEYSVLTVHEEMEKHRKK